MEFSEVFLYVVHDNDSIVYVVRLGGLFEDSYLFLKIQQITVS